MSPCRPFFLLQFLFLFCHFSSIHSIHYLCVFCHSSSILFGRFYSIYMCVFSFSSIYFRVLYISLQFIQFIVLLYTCTFFCYSSSILFVRLCCHSSSILIACLLIFFNLLARFIHFSSIYSIYRPALYLRVSLLFLFHFICAFFVISILFICASFNFLQFICHCSIHFLY